MFNIAATSYVRDNSLVYEPAAFQVNSSEWTPLVRAKLVCQTHIRELVVFDIRYESLISTNYRDGPAIACDRQIGFAADRAAAFRSPFHGDLSGHVSRWFLPLLTAKSLCCEGEREK